MNADAVLKPGHEPDDPQEPRAARYAPMQTGPRVPDRTVLDEVITRVIRVARPERIILFGSGARGTMGPHSDLDLLIVTEQVDDDGELDGDIHEALAGLEASFDIVTVTPGELARYGSAIGMVYRPALEEGRVLYKRGPASFVCSPALEGDRPDRFRASAGSTAEWRCRGRT